MRSIDATLLSTQKALGGDPVLQLVIGTSPTIDVSSFVLSYDYEEIARSPRGLTVVLDNKNGEFNSLTGSYAPIATGAKVELKRGLTVAGVDKVAELPTTYIEGWKRTYEGGQSLFILDCIDFWGLLERWRAASDQEWSATSATTILEWILTQVGLTREAGAMTALTLDFDIRQRATGRASLVRLLRKMPEYVHAGLDGEVKWREIDGGDSSAYTFSWNAEHMILTAEAGEEAWQSNSVTVHGQGSATGTASDATQITAVGTRKWTIYDQYLDSNAECEAAAQAELDLLEAEAKSLATITCRPCHGLELYDVVTLASPPWGGSNVVGRVARYREEWNHDGRWHQVIGLGDVPGKDPGNNPRGRKRRKGRRSRRGRSSSSGSRRGGVSHTYLEERLLELLPIGVITMWSGSSPPTGWALCNGGSGTPNLAGSFIVASGGAYSPGDAGGEDASNLAHTHGPGTLTTDEDTHNHGPGTLNTDSDSHTHGPGTLATDNDTHQHTFNDFNVGNETAWVTVQSGAGAEAARGGALHHAHAVPGSALGTSIQDDAHSHDVTSGVTANDTHDHDVDSGVTASDSHDHDVDSGATATAGSATQENRPVFYSLAFIMRVA